MGKGIWNPTVVNGLLEEDIRSLCNSGWVFEVSYQNRFSSWREFPFLHREMVDKKIKFFWNEMCLILNQFWWANKFLQKERCPEQEIHERAMRLLEARWEGGRLMYISKIEIDHFNNTRPLLSILSTKMFKVWMNLKDDPSTFYRAKCFDFKQKKMAFIHINTFINANR